MNEINNFPFMLSQYLTNGAQKFFIYGVIRCKTELEGKRWKSGVRNNCWWVGGFPDNVQV